MNIIYRAAAALTAAAIITTVTPMSALAMEKKPLLGVVDVKTVDGGLSYEIENTPESKLKTKSVEIGNVGSSENVEESSLPSEFSLAEQGLTTSVKDQGNSSACWAFSAVSCMEQNLIAKGLENSSVDFSEAALVWFASNTKSADGSIISVENPFEGGGNGIYVAYALSKFSGLEYEDYEPFFGYNSDAMVISEKQRNVCEYHLDSMTLYSNDSNEIKKAVMEKGGVAATYYENSDFYSDDRESYFNPSVSVDSVNHGVTIVGWDDNYSRENFNPENQPQNDGAWLVKSSYGNNYGDGYFYISYEEPELDDFTSFEMTENDNADNVYSNSDTHDMSLMYLPNTISGGNIFTAQKNEILKEASFFIFNSKGNEVRYTLDVYKDLESDSPLGKFKAATESGTISNDGYYTVDITAQPELNAGEKYSIVLTLDYSDDYSFIAFDRNGKCSEGESFVYDDEMWLDCCTSGYNNFVINAYTSDKAEVNKNGLKYLILQNESKIGVAKELDNAKKVYADESASVCDVRNAELLLQGAAENASTVVTISSISEWNDFAAAVANGDNMTGKIVLLESDLDFKDKEFAIVGSDESFFDGCFDGNGYTISGINYSTDGKFAGLFTAVDGNGRIKNTIVKNSSFSGNSVGGIAGGFIGVNMKNCGFTGTVNGEKTSCGLVGAAGCGTFESCYTDISDESSEISEDFYGLSSDETILFTKNLVTGDSYPEIAYKLNTISGSQTDSGIWTAEEDGAVLATSQKKPTIQVNFDVLGNTFTRYTDYKGNTVFPTANLQDGYELRWFIGDEKITQDHIFGNMVTVEGKAAKENSFTVLYVLNGGKNSDNNPDFLTSEESAVLSPATKDGHTFIGWYADEEFYGSPLTSLSDLTDDIKLYARWDANKYKVTFVDIEGNVISTQAVIYGSAANAPEAPEVEGMIFSQWDKDFSEITENLVISPEYAIHRNIEKCEVTGISNVTYDGSEQILSDIVVKYGDEALICDKDYTLTYENNVNAGTASIILTGICDYFGTKTVPFTIEPKDAASVAVNSISSKIYSGSNLKPLPVVKDGTVTLKNGTDYSLSYSNNKNAGTALVRITFRGNYSGTKTVSFKITPRSSSLVTIGTVSSKTYTGSAIKPKPVIKDGSVTLKNGTDYTLSYSGNTNAGTAKITVNFKGNYSGTRTVSFKINKCSVSKLKFGTIANKTYTGKQIKPLPTVKYGSKTLVKNKDYTLTYSNNVKTGKATVTVKLKGNYTGTKTLSFKILPKKVSGTSIKKTGSGKFKLSWNKANCTGYQIKYSTSSKFTSANTVWITKSSTKAKTVTGLNKGKTYYVKIRAYVKIGTTKYYGPYSSVVKIKV